MGRTEARKGAGGERELASLLQEYGYQIERKGTQTYGMVPDLQGLPGIHIEVKRVERLNIPAAMRQAVRDAEWFRDGAPTVFHRRNRENWLVTMRIEDWLKLYGGAEYADERTALHRKSTHDFERGRGNDGTRIQNGRGDQQVHTLGNT